MSDANDPAYPMTFEGRDGIESCGGLTKREAFAMAALQGFLANPGGPVQRSELSGWQSATNCSRHDVACEAVAYADALLVALEAMP